MAGPTHRTVRTNGIQMHLAEQGDGPVVVLCHGFPELWYSWRHQLAALADAGYRAVAPDMRGYGQTACPEAVDAYDIEQLTGDLTGLLDVLGEDDAVFVGHDFGANVVWNLSLLAPERVRAVVAMSVPFVPRSARDPIETLEAVFAGQFFYILYFQQPGVADAELAADPEELLRRLLRASPSRDSLGPVAPRPRQGTGYLDSLPPAGELPGWLRAADLEYYVAEFERTGFTGGLNWYRNISRNWLLTERVATAKVTVPALFVAGALDPVALFMPDTAMDAWVPELRGKVKLAGAGHWVQQERPHEVNAELLAFLASLD